MKWYERVASDPTGSFERLATRKGLTVEELKDRHRRIAEELGNKNNQHLTVNDWHNFEKNPNNLSQQQKQHLNNCKYCKGLGAAFSPTAIAHRTKGVVDKFDIGISGSLATPEPQMRHLSLIKSSLNSAKINYSIFATLCFAIIGLGFYFGVDSARDIQLVQQRAELTSPNEEVLTLSSSSLSPHPDPWPVQNEDETIAMLAVPDGGALTGAGAGSGAVARDSAVARAETAAESDTLYVLGELVNLRDGPSTNHPVVLQLEQGQKLIEFKRDGRWVHVGVYGSLKIGWIYDTLVSVDIRTEAAIARSPVKNEDEDEDETIVMLVHNAGIEAKNEAVAETVVLSPTAGGPPSDTLYVLGELVNLRDGPSTNHPIVLQLEQGQELIEFKRDGRWVHVGAYGTSKIGWVHNTLVGTK